MTNICPMNPSLNRFYCKRIEDSTRKLLDVANRIHVITGPLFLPTQAENGNWYVSYQVISQNAEGGPVAVPTHFFKIILVEYESRCESYGIIVPNKEISKNIPYSKFAVSINQIERKAGFILSDFLRNRMHIKKNQVNILK